MSDLQAVRDDLDTTTSALDDLRTALKDGDDVDLDSFNRMVSQTCQAAVTLPKADAPKVRQQLEQLLTELNVARDEIAAEQARLAAAIEAGEADAEVSLASGNDDTPYDEPA